MSLILGGSLILIGGCCLYKNTILYNLIKAYTYYLNEYNEMNENDEMNDLPFKKIGLEYLDYDFEKLVMIKSDEFKNNEFSVSKLIYNKRSFISFTDNLKPIFIDHINDTDNITFNSFIHLPYPLLSCTCDIYINNKKVTDELDITHLINMFCFTNEQVHLNNKYSLLMFYFINHEYSLNIDLNKMIEVDNKNIIPKSVLNIKYNGITKDISMFEGDNLILLIDNDNNINVETM